MESTYLNRKVVVADNCSKDDSVAFLRENYPDIEILQNRQNDGFAGGYNWALKMVDADYYVLLNSDVRVEKNWIEPVIDMMEKDNSIAAVQPKILSLRDPGSFEYAGAAGGCIDLLGYPFSRGRIFDLLERDEGQFDQPCSIFWATGASLFIRSGVFHEMGGFDDTFFAHQEEIDLCWRIQLAGYKIMVCPSSRIFHLGGGTLPAGPHKIFLNFRNNLMMLYKNLPFKERCWKIPLRLFMDLANGGRELMKGHFYYTWSVLKAHWAFFFRIIFRIYGPKAPLLQSLKKLDGVYPGSIVYEYFIRKKKKIQDFTDNDFGK